MNVVNQMQMGGVEMVTHHIAAFISVFVTVWYREVHMYTLILLATECTTPVINFRWLLEKMVGYLLPQRLEITANTQ